MPYLALSFVLWSARNRGTHWRGRETRLKVSVAEEVKHEEE